MSINGTPGAQGAVIAGWYPDPAGSGRSRWWDGAQWTDSFETPYSLAPQQLTAPAGTSPFTPFVWGIVGLLAVRILLNFTLLVPGYFEATAMGDSSKFATLDLITSIASFVIYGVSVALAYFDWRTLRDAGVPRPFHWAFEFIPLPVYLIGRGVITRRRTGSGISIMWTAIGYLAISGAIGLFVAIVTVSYVFENTPY